jgi:ankyrin repeat protein
MMQLKRHILTIFFLIACCANASPNELLHRGMKKCDLEKIRKALRKGADPNAPSTTDEWGYAPLHVGVINNCYSAIYYLLTESQAHVDILDNLERTPLYRAALLKNYKIFDLLLRHGADPHYADIDAITPAMLAQSEIY